MLSGRIFCIKKTTGMAGGYDFCGKMFLKPDGLFVGVIYKTVGKVPKETRQCSMNCVIP
jgi:hypothetical protein